MAASERVSRVPGRLAWVSQRVAAPRRGSWGRKISDWWAIAAISRRFETAARTRPMDRKLSPGHCKHGHGFTPSDYNVLTITVTGAQGCFQLASRRRVNGPTAEEEGLEAGGAVWLASRGNGGGCSFVSLRRQPRPVRLRLCIYERVAAHMKLTLLSINYQFVECVSLVVFSPSLTIPLARLCIPL